MTLTQSENLKIGERGVYVPKSNGALERRCCALGIVCWLEKRAPKPMDASERTLREFVDMGERYELVYGITFEGKDYDCGDMPRDLGGVVKGIAIARRIT